MVLCLPSHRLAASAMALGSSQGSPGPGGLGGGGERDLAAVLSGYCCQGPSGEGEQGEDEAVAHLNMALLHVQRAKRLDEVVTALGPHLTSQDSKVSRPDRGGGQAGSSK